MASGVRRRATAPFFSIAAEDVAVLQLKAE